MAATVESDIEPARPTAASGTPSPKRPSLRRNVTWTFAGNIVNSLCQWALLVVLTRWGSPETAGVYAIVLATVQPAFAFASLQLREVQVTDARSEFRLGDFLLVRIVSTLIAIAVIAAIAWTALSATVSPVVVLVFGVIQAADALTDLLHGQLQKLELMGRVARSMMLRGIGSLAAFSIVFANTQDLGLAALGMLVTRIVVMGVYDVPLFARLLRDPRERPLFSGDKRRYLSLLRIGGAFALFAGIISLRGNVPRWLVWNELGERELGTFVIAASLVMPFQLMTQALYQSAFPRLTRYFASDKYAKLQHLMRRLFALTTVLAAIVAIVALAVGNLVVEHVFLIESQGTTGVIICMAIAVALQAAAKPAGVLARLNRSLGMAIGLQAGGIVVLFALGWWLIPIWGIFGAAAAYAATSAITTALVHTLVFSKLNSQVQETDLESHGGSRQAAA